MEAIPILLRRHDNHRRHAVRGLSSLLGGSGASVTIINGGKLNLENNSLTLGDVTVTDNGSIISGSLTAGSLEMDNATARPA